MKEHKGKSGVSPIAERLRLACLPSIVDKKSLTKRQIGLIDQYAYPKHIDQNDYSGVIGHFQRAAPIRSRKAGGETDVSNYLEETDMKKFTITIKDLPEDMQISNEELEKVTGGILQSLATSINKAPIIKAAIPINPVAETDNCDCWSQTACMCRS